MQSSVSADPDRHRPKSFLKSAVNHLSQAACRDSEARASLTREPQRSAGQGQAFSDVHDYRTDVARGPVLLFGSAWPFQAVNTSTQSGSPPALLPDGEKLWRPVFENVPMFVYDSFVGSSQRAVTDTAKVDIAVSALLLPCGK